jgi:type IV fimbrial biogenesis protein FimT
MERHRHTGLTLFELLIALTILGMLFSTAVPALSTLIERNAAAVLANELVADLYLARSTAATQARRVTLCKTGGGGQCIAAGGYELGWMVFADPNENGRLDETEQVLRVRQPSLPAGATIAGNRMVASYVSYGRMGETRMLSGAFQAGTLRLCVRDTGRNLVVNRLGRVRVDSANC